jgi:hypothetical protein
LLPSLVFCGVVILPTQIYLNPEKENDYLVLQTREEDTSDLLVHSATPGLGRDIKKWWKQL